MSLTHFFLFLTYVKEFISWIIPELQWPNQRDVKYIFFHSFLTNCSPKKVRMAPSLLTRWDSACSWPLSGMCHQMVCPFSVSFAGLSLSFSPPGMTFEEQNVARLGSFSGTFLTDL